jgi:rod shape determining protein RodA
MDRNQMYFVDRSDGFKYFRSFDYLLFFSVIILSLVGIVILSSAVQTFRNPRADIIKQLVSIILGVIIALSISIFDYRYIKNISFILYGVCVLLLLAVFFVGYEIENTGAKSWLDFKVITFQPSELAKIASILIISKFIEDIKNGEGRFNIIKILVFFIIPLGLILKQPDLGTAMVYCFIMLVLVFIAGIKYRYIIITSILSIGFIPILWGKLDQYRKDRILTFLDPGLDPLGKGYHVIRSKIAIGSGGFLGQGLYNGIQSQSEFGLPVKESDFIFAVHGEEFGFIGTTLLIVLFAFMILKCIQISMKAKDHFGKLVAAGIAAMWMFHFIENVGMCIGLMPVTGIPLPFISQGGSAMLTNFMALGVLMSISMRNQETSVS